MVETVLGTSGSEVQFQPIHGISIPEVDFYSYNRMRPITSVEVYETHDINLYSIPLSKLQACNKSYSFCVISYITQSVRGRRDIKHIIIA